MKPKSLLPMAAAAFAASCSVESQDRMNVLFIMVDDLKPSLGCYGDPYAITPAIDSLAADGVVYDRAYCQQALSGPSRASIMTGLRPWENGVTELNTWMREKNPDLITLPQAFRNAGYTTVSVGKTCHGDRNTMDSLSWSVSPMLYQYGKNDEYMLQVNKTGKKAASFESYDGPEDAYLDVNIREEALRQLEVLSMTDSPFFLAVGFLKPHLPFCAPERFFDLYEDVDFRAPDTTRIQGAPALAYHDSNELRGYVDIGKKQVGINQHIALKKAYYACVSYADENIGMLLAKLKELGLYENTVVVLVGDHGFHTGELGLWCKSTNYEAACHSPLIIRSPRNEHVHVKNPVELIDIYPTLAALCDVKAPDSLSGKDLAEISEGDRTYAFSQFPRPYAALHNASKRTHMGYAVRDDRWRYVEWYDNDGNMAARELYDLGSDLLETENLADSNEHVDVVAHFSDMLRSCRQ